MVEVRNARRLWSGALFLGIGLLALWQMPRPLGTLVSMGPGYFPMLLGSALTLLGAGSVLVALRSSDERKVAAFPLVPAFFVLSGVVLMATLIAGRGLAVSLACLVATSCYARLFRHPLQVLAIYLVLLGLTWVVFIYAINLPIGLI